MKKLILGTVLFSSLVVNAFASSKPKDYLCFNYLSDGDVYIQAIINNTTGYFVDLYFGNVKIIDIKNNVAYLSLNTLRNGVKLNRKNAKDLNKKNNVIECDVIDDKYLKKHIKDKK